MPVELTIPAELRRHADSDHLLLICDADRLSYAEAYVASARLARGLLALGVGKGTHLGLLYPNGSEFVVAMLATARIGAVVVPFSTFGTAAELRSQLAAADIAILLSARSYRGNDYTQRLADISVEDAPALERVCFDTGELIRLGESVGPAVLAAREEDVDGSDTLAIIYTSGSTGPPKGAVHTHASLLGHQHNLNEIRGLTGADRLFCNSPLFWIGGFAFGLLATLVAGSTLICSNAADAAETLDLLEAEKPTVTNGFAAGIAHLAGHRSFAGRDLSSMRRGNLYPIMAPDTRPADPGLRHNMLGMTEAGSVVLLSGDEGDQPESRRGSYGKPAPGFETMLLDTGELFLRGPYLMQRYYGRSREECFDADGWFHTGDRFRIDADGFYYFLGRAGSMIKTAGANVTPAEVEKALTAVLGNSVTAHVLGLPDAERGQIVAAVLVLDDPTAFDEELLRSHLRELLSAYKIPRQYAVVPRAELPLLSSGKVDIPALTRLFDG
jgi:acyl-CoA synthetase (AMP-forming)/AMP-acid ligase II